MTAAGEDLTLAGEFDAPTREQWRELVAGVLARSGREVSPSDAEAALATVTDDGITIAGLYAAEDAPDVDTGVPGLPPFVRGARAEGQVAEGWLVRQRHAFPPDVDLGEAHDVVMAELENGVSSLWLVLGEAGGPSADALPRLLEGVFVDLAPIALEAGRDTPAAAAALLRLAEENGAGAIGGSLGYDPLLDRTHGGAPLDDTYRGQLVEHARTAAASHPQLRTVVADGLPYHRAGGSDAQELGAALAAGVHALRVLTEAGLDTDDAFRRIEFRFAATADQFATLAKLRAARRCWDRIGEVSGASENARAMHQHAVTSPAMITRRDPWVNMLRTTVAAVGAGLGGAAAVTVLPFDNELGRPDEAARRLARNTQALLLEESHLAHVIDPAGGSWYVESLTDALAQAAWAEFTRTERDGGIATALDDGSLRARLDETWQRRSTRIARRKDPITGVSEFPNLHEELPRREPAPDTPHDGGLPRRRYAEIFETLRDRADAAQQRPTVFLATIGTLAEYTARVSFTQNLLGAGGIATTDGPGGTEPQEIAAAFREAGTTVAVIASSDKIYDQHAAEVAAALREAGATRILLAGRKDVAGVDGTLHAGCDAAAVLRDTLDHLAKDQGEV
ncbi:methylmalonyl-CoA mutase family protein [Actinomycetospora cinnamomea]|uniref:Heterodimeric methylmalonyl-CoA mutase small subunit n=1 Tax=Actinomycetospora cinnamomea TaxID=663609 RepID=A0A2U1FLA2_9PSEU|nr:methylmalonyl-CoA mutase family protein [Actinomycetospora cinnamomea]PVZ12947.1 heterodimeric methylmalonyl-CoA mutase small subunit [Actinomycetospora cinnamomea]